MKSWGISDISYALGENLIDNAILQKHHPDWDMDQTGARTGVIERYHADDGTTSLDLAMRACEALFTNGRQDIADIDGIIFCTSTPNHILPSNAFLLHKELRFKEELIAFDVNLACSGFVYCLGMVDGFMRRESVNTFLLITGDTYSKILDRDDRATSVLFGDGVACTILTKSRPKFEFLDIDYYSSGKNADRFIINEKLLEAKDHVQAKPKIKMDGLGVLSFFNSKVPAAIDKILMRNALNIDQVDIVIPHQASKLALDGISRVLGISEDKFIVDIASTGNLTSASIPVALERLGSRYEFKAGQIILLVGFGAGLSWAVSLLRVTDL